jgi:hypothetical protein
MHLILARALKGVGYMLQSNLSPDLLPNMDVPSLSHHLIIRTPKPYSPREEFAKLMDFCCGEVLWKYSSATPISWRRETTVRIFS